MFSLLIVVISFSSSHICISLPLSHYPHHPY
jgi:hypothetical protein